MLHIHIKKIAITILTFAFLTGCAKSYDKLIGRFDHQDNEYTYIILNDDSSCEFVFSYFEGVCKTKGTYITKSDKLIITLIESDPASFLGDNYQAGYISSEYIFTIIDENTLQIDNAIYAAYKKSTFVRQGG